MERDLMGLFEPKSIAVVGASREPKKVGAIVLKNIIRSGYSGKIYPINPNVDNLGRLKFYKSLGDLPEVPNLVIVAVPAKVANMVLEEAGKLGIKNAVIFSAGYKEEGEEGITLEKKLKNIAEKYSINVLGPNCLGFNNKSFNLNATFGADIENKGNLRIISQSGAIATALVDWAKVVNLGFEQLVTLGNKTVVCENDVLEYWKKVGSLQLRVGSYPTGMYLESISDGKNLTKILKEYSKENLVFILKPGKSPGAVKAMMSHTGAIAGEDSVLDEAIKESGAIRCQELSDFFEMCMATSNGKVPLGPAVAVITNAGGPAVLSTDTVEKYGLKLAELSEETRTKLDRCLPRMASFMNPVDVLGDSLSDRFGEALEIVLQEKNVDSVVVILTPQLMTEIKKTAEIISKLSEKYPQPTFCSFIGGSKIAAGENVLNHKKIANFDYPERAIYCLAKLWEWKKGSIPLSPPLEKGEESFLDNKSLLLGQVDEILKQAKENNQRVLDSFQADKLMKVLGVVTPETAKINTALEGINFAKENGWPVVLKISGGDLLHKTEVGGVMVDIKSEYQLKKAFVKMKRPDYDIEIQQQIEGGVEVILGMKRDPNFGLVTLFGAGGKMAELIKDRNLRLSPLTEEKLESMITGSKVYTLLNGFRNDKVYDLGPLYKIIFTLEKLMTECSEILEIEINPAIITHQKTYCVDVKVLI